MQSRQPAVSIDEAKSALELAKASAGGKGSIKAEQVTDIWLLHYQLSSLPKHPSVQMRDLLAVCFVLLFDLQRTLLMWCLALLITFVRQSKLFLADPPYAESLSCVNFNS